MFLAQKNAELPLQQEAQRRQGVYFPEQIKTKRTFADLVGIDLRGWIEAGIDRYVHSIHVG